MNNSQPSLWIFAGPNGAGKSTLVRQYKVDSRIPIVNPDDIANEIDIKQGSHSLTVQVKAGRIAVERRAQLFAKGLTFGIETTLSGRSELKLMRAAKERGYKVNLIYVGLDNADQSNSRVIARVRRGGHDVPERDIYRRFGQSLANLADAIRISDRVRILDNSNERKSLILKIDRGRTRIVSRTMPEWAKAAIPRNLRRLSRNNDLGY